MEFVNIKHFALNEQFLNFIGTEEISQEENPNATTRLFIHNEGYVTKLFIGEPYETEKNKRILLAIVQNEDLMADSRFAAPIDLLYVDDELVGYTMPYIRGRTLADYLADTCIGDREKWNCFEQLFHAISDMPIDIHIGDLHLWNVIISDDGNIHLIDLDGFSIDGIEQMSCPLHCYPDSFLKNISSVYFDENGHTKVSKQSDYLCTALMMLDYMLESRPFSSLSLQTQRMYFVWMFFQKVPKTVLKFFWEIVYWGHINEKGICALCNLGKKNLSYSSFQSMKVYQLCQSIANKKITLYIEGRKDK